jgi:hypothetical protein
MKLSKLVLFYGVIWIGISISSAIYYWSTTSDFIELIGFIIISYMFSILIIWVIVSSGSVFRHCLWGNKGYSDMPVFIFPFVIGFNGSKRCHVTIDPMSMWALITPSQYCYDVEKEQPWSGFLAYKTENNTFRFQIGISILIILVSINYFNMNIKIAAFAALLGFIATALVKDEIYNGKITMILLLKDGAILEFVLNNAIVYNLEVNLFNHSKNYIVKERNRSWQLHYLHLLTCKFMLIMACACQEKLNATILHYIETALIRPFQLGRLFFNRETIEIIKLHMYYCIIHDEDKRLFISLNKLFELADRNRNDISEKMKDEFERYINIGQNRRINDNPVFKRDLVLIKKDIPYSNFDLYLETVSKAEKEVYAKCTIRSKIVGSNN